MDVFIGTGEERPSSILKNTTTLKVGEWLDYDVKDRLFLAAVPKLAANQLKISYQIKYWTQKRNTLDEDTKKTLIYVQLGIVGGGLAVAVVLLLMMCFVKRFKRWFEL